MPQPAPRSKPRFALFSVGKNKASPARTASTKRASLRLSAARTDARRLPLEFTATDAARLDRDPPEAKWEQRGGSCDPAHTPSEDDSEIPVPDMKNTALPPLPQEAAPQAHASASAPRPRPAERPSAPAVAADARTPPPPPKSGPSRLPPQPATMPPSRTQSQTQAPASNLFRRFTSKLRGASTPSASTSAKSPHAPPLTIGAPERKRSALRMPKAPVPAAPPNDFTSREQRQAALRARGLLPASSAYRDAHGFMVPLSEQEAELDRRYTVVVEDKDAEESEAKKIREAWLARNQDANTSGSGRPSLDVAEDDATRRASYDGKIGDRSALQPTLVASKEDVSAMEATVESFSPAGVAGAAANRDAPPRDPPGSPSSHSSAVTEKVSRWLRSSTDVPTPTSLSVSTSTDPSTVQPAAVLSESPTEETASPSGTVRAKPRKEKPPPIVVTTQRTSKEKAKEPAQLITLAVAAISDSESSANASTSTGTSPPQARGRQATQGSGRSQPHPPLLGHSTSSASSGSRSTTLPALSPTRTVSSSGADSTLPTPTTLSCQRDASISHGSTSHSSDQSHTGVRARRSSDEVQAQVKAKASARVSGGLMQSSIEETDSSEEGEFGEAAPMPPIPTTVPAARPRPQRAQTAEQAAEAQHNRKSFSLFGKKSSDSSSNSSNARTSSSMSNLRRAFSGGLTSKLQPRPRSSVDTSTSQPELGPKRARMFDGSRLPPTSFPGGAGGAAVPVQGRTTGVGPRPRQALAPTMHSRGSILHQAHAIEDDESRRLSEMAFLL